MAAVPYSTVKPLASGRLYQLNQLRLLRFSQLFFASTTLIVLTCQPLHTFVHKGCQPN